MSLKLLLNLQSPVHPGLHPQEHEAQAWEVGQAGHLRWTEAPLRNAFIIFTAIITFTIILLIMSQWELVLFFKHYESSFLQKTLYQKVWGWLSVLNIKEWTRGIIILDLPQVLIISQNIGGQLQIHTDWPSPLRWVMTIRQAIEYTHETWFVLDLYFKQTPDYGNFVIQHLGHN